MKTIVLSDLHNREFIAKDLFRKLGIMDEDGNPNLQEGERVISLGDVVSLGYGEQEAEFLKWVRPFITEQLVGNHEYPAFGPYPNQMMFVGYENRDVVAEQMVRAEFTKARMENDPNMWVAAASVGDYLITHAGLSIRAQKELANEGWDGTAKGAADMLNEMWIDHIENKTPENIFIGTHQAFGGIFWVRIDHLRAGYRSQHLNQVVGHTPLKEPGIQNKDGNLYCIDTYGDCCALVTEDDGKTWTIVRSDYEIRWWENRDGRRSGGPVYERGTEHLVRS